MDNFNEEYFLRISLPLNFTSKNTNLNLNFPRTKRYLLPCPQLRGYPDWKGSRSHVVIVAWYIEISPRKVSIQAWTTLFNTRVESNNDIKPSIREAGSRGIENEFYQLYASSWRGRNSGKLETTLLVGSEVRGFRGRWTRARALEALRMEGFNSQSAGRWNDLL